MHLINYDDLVCYSKRNSKHLKIIMSTTFFRRHLQFSIKPKNILIFLCFNSNRTYYFINFKCIFFLNANLTFIPQMSNVWCWELTTVIAKARRTGNSIHLNWNSKSVGICNIHEIKRSSLLNCPMIIVDSIPLFIFFLTLNLVKLFHRIVSY